MGIAWGIVIVLGTMLVAAILLVAGQSASAHFGLVGGGMYAYLAGRGVSTRATMQRRGYRVDDPGDIAAYTFLVIWGAMGAIAIAVASVALATS